MTVRDLFPASVLMMSGLFLSGFLPFFPVSSLLFLLIGGGMAAFFLGRKGAPLLFLSGGVLLGFTHPSLPSPFPDRSGTSPFSGCIRMLPETVRHGSWILLENADRTPALPSTVRLFIPKNRLPGPLSGDDCLTGTLTPYPEAKRPSSFFRQALPSYRIAPWDSLRLIPGETLVPRLLRAANRLSMRLVEHLQSAYPPETSSLLCALVLSNTLLVSPDILTEFQRSGVSHLLSVSGEHMTLLALFLGGSVLAVIRILPLSFLRNLLVRAPLLPILVAGTLPILALYTVIIGMPSAAVRAFLGFLLVSVLKIFFVELDFKDVLGASTLIMLVTCPELIHSLSFTLSILALWGIVLRRNAPAENDGILPHRPGKVSGLLSEAFLTGLTITLLTAPLLASVFHTVNSAGIISNPVIVPIAGDILLPAGFLELSTFLASGHSLSFLTGLVTTVSHMVLGLVHGFASLPGAVLRTPSPLPALLLVFYLTVVSLLLIPGRLSLPRTLLGLAVLLALSLAAGNPSPGCAAVPALEIMPGTLVHYLPRTERKNLASLFRCPDPAASHKTLPF